MHFWENMYNQLSKICKKWKIGPLEKIMQTIENPKQLMLIAVSVGKLLVMKKNKSKKPHKNIELNNIKLVNNKIHSIV